MRRFVFIIVFSFFSLSIFGAEKMKVVVVEKKPACSKEEKFFNGYTVGAGDILEISVLQPEKIQTIVTVAPDGFITFPYLGNVYVKGLTLSSIQKKIQEKLSNGYMKFPVVVVALKECRSRKFFVYGEVVKPGAYPMSEDITVLKAISMAGGFTKFGSSSKVKVLRPRKNEPGYDVIKIDLKAVMNGKSEADILVKPEDIIVVSEGIF